jgi:RNA polymerase sigma-70 factor, ECF subfamily
MTESAVDDKEARQAFDRLLGELRPKLHRYCARMTGSVVDGQDVVQDALLKAIEAYAATPAIANVEAWLFRIAHNAALDFLRQRNRREPVQSTEEMEAIVDATNAVSEREGVHANLRTLMRLSIMQRSSIVLMDVFGYTEREVSHILDTSVPSVKAALHRGRQRLRVLVQDQDSSPQPALSEPERSRLISYVERFNAREFDSLRDMLAEDVRAELVNRSQIAGRSELNAKYFYHYGQSQDWRLAAGFVDTRPAILVHHPDDPLRRVRYFILLDWTDGRVTSIRDFVHARYVVEAADIMELR